MFLKGVEKGMNIGLGLILIPIAIIFILLGVFSRKRMTKSLVMDYW